MKLAFMRYLVGDAGNVKRLYWAVKSASESSTDDVRRLWDYFKNRYGAKDGLERARSAEPHFSLARELNLLEWRGRWRITNGPGKAFLALWNDVNPPKYLLLSQVLNYDNSFMVPFLSRLLLIRPLDKDLVKTASKTVNEVWTDLTVAYKADFVSAEPPLPLRPEPRTCDHHARARLRLIFGFPNHEGLNLTWEQIERLCAQFKVFEGDASTPDYYFKLGYALNGILPASLSEEELVERNQLAFRMLRGFEYASVKAAFQYINETILPNKAIDWNRYQAFLRKRKGTSFHQGFSRDDVLFTMKNGGK